MLCLPRVLVPGLQVKWTSNFIHISFCLFPASLLVRWPSTSWDLGVHLCISGTGKSQCVFYKEMTQGVRCPLPVYRKDTDVPLIARAKRWGWAADTEDQGPPHVWPVWSWVSLSSPRSPSGHGHVSLRLGFCGCYQPGCRVLPPPCFQLLFLRVCFLWLP